MTRPRGGRAAPRYHHVKDAAEERMWRLMHTEKPVVNRTDEMLQKIAMFTMATDAVLARAKRRLG